MPITSDVLDCSDVTATIEVVDKPVLIECEPFLTVVTTLEEPEVEESRVQDDPEPVDDVEDEAGCGFAVLRSVHVDAQDVEEQADEEDAEPDQRDRTIFGFPPLK